MLEGTTENSDWGVPDSKPPLPSSDTCLLGADVRHREHGPELGITETRIDTLEQLLLEHLNSNHSNVDAAGKLYGRLSATSSQDHGKWGRAKLGPIKTRQYDHHNKH